MRRGEGGYVLVVVLWLVAILTVVTLGFGHRALLDRRASANAIDQLQAQYMARGAVLRGVAAVRNQQAVDQTRSEREGSNVDDSWRRIPDLLGDDGVYSLGSAVETQGEACRAVIEDAEARISLNTAPAELLEEAGIGSFETVNAILERRDTDETEPATPFLAIEEVRTFDGVLDDDWFGDDDTPGLRDLLTVWGDGKININTASREVLTCVPDLSESAIDAIIESRPISSLERFASEQSLMTSELESLRTYCKVASSVFIIRGIATQRQKKVIAQCVATVEMTDEGPVMLDWQELPIGQ